jgi:UDP-N-acetylglucosamine 2-epimerase (non-hydrolysing)
VSRVVVVIGTRPEAIKMAPVVRALVALGVRPNVVSTGQHPQLVRQALDVFGLVPDTELRPVPAGADLHTSLAHMVSSIGAHLAARRPDLVLVHGDTTSALAGALAATYNRVLVAHVEAGLRSGVRDEPFPEEVNRLLVDRASNLWFAPTERARQALLAEGCPSEVVFVTGNPVVDAVNFVVGKVGRLRYADLPALPVIPLTPWILVTSHRRESRGKALESILTVVERLARQGYGIVWPVHRIPEVEQAVEARLGALANVQLTGPLPYPAFVRLLLGTSLILTDSGGVQEEAAVLGRPTLVLRSGTERPEVLATGVVRLVGTDVQEIEKTALTWLNNPPTAYAGSVLGDGKAADRIAAVVAHTLG